MAKNVTPSQLSIISPALGRHLDQRVGSQSQDERETVLEKLGDASTLLKYDVCTWWDGCYYCRDEDGNWTEVKCYL
ncbi:MAG: hypothetical protein HC924_11425 [Synechococcaceae cyanobacterium SM2_3_2]|nr:hypothetical protein [Synechococcaceae cyanobacterium SM2_3_2]